MGRLDGLKEVRGFGFVLEEDFGDVDSLSLGEVWSVLRHGKGGRKARLKFCGT